MFHKDIESSALNHKIFVMEHLISSHVSDLVYSFYGYEADPNFENFEKICLDFGNDTNFGQGQLSN